MTTKILSGESDIYSEVSESLAQFSDVVGSTAGPLGRLVAIRRHGSAPHPTKDGMTVARAFRAQDFAGVAVDIVRQSALETGRKAGDGTTTASVLSVHLYQSLFSEDDGAFERNDEDLLWLEENKEALIDVVRRSTIQISGKEDLYGVTYTSCNGDHTIAEPITKAFLELGPSGAITVEEDRSRTDIGIKWIDGVTIPAGFASPYFVLDGSGKVVLENALVFFSITPLEKPDHITPVLQYAHQARRPLLVIAENVSDEVLSMLISNNAEDRVKICVVNSPYTGSLRATALTDLSAVVGATPCSRGFAAKDIHNLLGGAKKIVVESKMVSFFEAQGKTEEIIKIKGEVRELLRNAQDDAERAHAATRLARLEGRAAIIQVGGATPAELAERKDRADDALASARWAMIEGIVAGGGSSLCRVFAWARDNGASEDLAYAFLAPVDKVYENFVRGKALDVESAFDMVRRVLENLSEEPNCAGYDLRSGNWRENLVASGVIDSSYAVREALSSAISSAITLAKLNAIVINTGSDEEF